jgi:hypothetical protein
MTEEEQRLQANRNHTAYWTRWGPYLSERQWGTVREDYSADGSAWEFFPHDHARSRAYRWGEDGIAGICDNHQRLCFAITLWNGEDSILKERLFGLTGNEGNHGEDVKEYYFYLDNTPTHSYMKYLYKYPQAAFPYEQLVRENQRRDSLTFENGKAEQDSYASRYSLEYELLDTGIFDSNRYFDVEVEYAKNSPEDILIQISITNRGAEAKTLHLLPTLWFRNTWSWGYDSEKPILRVCSEENDFSIIAANHPTLGQRSLYCERKNLQQFLPLLFTENETNFQKLFGVENASPYVKDAFHTYLIHNCKDAINPLQIGTKCAAQYELLINAGETQTIKFRLSDSPKLTAPFGAEFNQVFLKRMQEADNFYHRICPFDMSLERRQIQRQAFAGMLWNKQFYYYVVEKWLKGDPADPPPPVSHTKGRNSDWIHLFNDDVLSMPDKWEYPWFSSWDLAFHLIPLVMIDPDFAKLQLSRLLREWYMHPNGQIPAYEWGFNDVNPPVHAWAALKIYQIERELYNRTDKDFLERVFQKLLLNFTWWVNRKDVEGRNVFQGGFLGLDNIGIFDRSSELPTGGYLQQADGTSWMGMYCLNMLEIALELAKFNPTYEDIASKFFEHFLYIADAIDGIGQSDISLWDENDGFYYDALCFPDGHYDLMKVRSLVGLIPLFSVSIIESGTLSQFPGFSKRTKWFINNRPDLTQKIACIQTPGMGERRLLAIAYPDKLRRILQRMLAESEFLSPYGIRSVSKFHQNHPYTMNVNGTEYKVDYQPAESTTNIFGGNSNWRGPIWFPINYLIIESLQRFYSYFGDDFKVEFPTGSGREITLQEVAVELSERLIQLFLQNESEQRPCYGGTDKFQHDPHWRDLILFHEYFHGDNGAGIGASHQTGWTGIVARLIQQCAKYKSTSLEWQDSGEQT